VRAVPIRTENEVQKLAATPARAQHPFFFTSVLGKRWLDPAWDFPIGALDTIQSSVQPEHSKTPSWQQNVLGNCGAWDTLSLTENLLLPFLRVFA
jgi:hypothetical protein